MFDLQEFLSSFIVLFAIIDVTGLIPVVIDLQQKSGPVNAKKAAIYSLLIMVAFLYAGNAVLQLFNVDINSFAVAGGFIIFLLGVEMTLGIEIFKYSDGPKGSTTLVPVVFPLIAGAGTFTTLLSLRAEFGIFNILLGLLANVLIIYLVLKNVNRIECLLKPEGIYVLRKFFGIILLAIAVKLVAGNLNTLLN